MFLNDKSVLSTLEHLASSGVRATCLNFSAEQQPYIGRNHLIRDTLVRLACKYKSSILLSGEPGSGKTSFVKALAKRFGVGSNRRNSSPYIFDIPIASLLADTRYRGEFEKKVTSLFEVLSGYENAIVFFDEAHVMKNTGGDSGINMLDMLKPILLAPTTKVILASTPIESQRLLDDEAFARRLHQITIPPLEQSEVFAALQAHALALAAFHGVPDPGEELLLGLLKTRSPLHEMVDRIDLHLAGEKLHGQIEHYF